MTAGFYEAMQKHGFISNNIERLYNGLDEIHKAIADLDSEQQYILNEIGVANLINEFAKCEKLITFPKLIH